MNAPKAAHTPGPWIENENLRGDGSSAGSFAIWTNSEKTHYICEVPHKANAARIVACVNACEGIETDKLTTKGVRAITTEQMIEWGDSRTALRAEVARLREALKWAYEFAQGTHDIPDNRLHNPVFEEWLQKCRAALGGGK